MRKKLWSIVLSLAMLATLAVPFGAAAEEGTAETSFLQAACTSVTTSIPAIYSTVENMVDGSYTTTYKSNLRRSAENPEDLSIEIQLNAVYRIDKVKVFERFIGTSSCSSSIDVYVGNTLTGDVNWTLAKAGTVPNVGTNGANTETAISLSPEVYEGSAIKFVLHGNAAAAPDGETLYQINELEAFGEKVGEMPANVCLNQAVTTNFGTKITQLPESHITDGIIDPSTSNRYSSGPVTDPLTVTISLNGVYNIGWADVTLRLPAVANNANCDYVKVEAGKTNVRSVIEWTTANADGQTAINQTGAAGALITTKVPFSVQVEADTLRFTFSRLDYSEAKPYEIAEIRAYGTYVDERYVETNILRSAHIETDIDAINATLSEARLADGDTKTYRYASPTNVTKPLTVTFALDGRYDMAMFRIYKRFDEANTGTTGDGVEILCGIPGADGVMQWTKAVAGKLEDRKGANGAIEATEFVLEKDVLAEVIRMIFTKPEAARQYQFAEIEAMGLKQANVTTNRLVSVSYVQNGESVAICPANGSFTAHASYEGITDHVSVFMLYDSKGLFVDLAVDTGNGAVFNVAEGKTIKRVRVLTFESMQNLRPLLTDWHTKYYPNTK